MNDTQNSIPSLKPITLWPSIKSHMVTLIIPCPWNTTGSKPSPQSSTISQNTSWRPQDHRQKCLLSIFLANIGRNIWVPNGGLWPANTPQHQWPFPFLELSYSARDIKDPTVCLQQQITSTRPTQSAICFFLSLAEPSLPNTCVTLSAATTARPPGGPTIWLLGRTGALPWQKVLVLIGMCTTAMCSYSIHYSLVLLSFIKFYLSPCFNLLLPTQGQSLYLANTALSTFPFPTFPSNKKIQFLLL